MTMRHPSIAHDVGHISSVAALSIILVVSSAHAKMGDCGQPTNNSSGDTPLASDALNILSASVGLLPCHPAVCDVNASGGTVTTNDALLVLKKAVAQLVTLTCPACDADVCTACSETAIRSRIDALNMIPAGTSTNPSPQLLTSETSTIFRCGGNIDLNDSTWTNKAITRDGVIFAADDRGIRMQLEPRCHERCLGKCTNNTDCTQNRECGSGNSCTVSSITECTQNSDCGVAGRCSVSVCPDINSNARRFLALNGDDITVRGFEVDGFFEGIHVNGERDIVEDMVLTRMCDDAIGNDASGVGGVLRNSTVQRGCDKCSEHATGPTINPATCIYPECYHMIYEDDVFDGCKLGVRAANASTRILISGADFSPQGSSWPCDIAVFPGNSGVVTAIDDSSSSTCNTGIWFGNGTHSVAQSTLNDNDQRGVMVNNASAQVVVRDSKITNNGGESSGEPTGGVVIKAGAADLGTGASSPGHNCIHGNTTGSGVPMEVNNQTVTEVRAQFNYWGGSTNPAVDEPVDTANVWSGPCQ